MFVDVLSIKVFPGQPKIVELELDKKDRADEGKYQKVTLAIDPGIFGGSVTVNKDVVKGVTELLNRALLHGVSVELELPANDTLTIHKAAFKVS